MLRLQLKSKKNFASTPLKTISQNHKKSNVFTNVVKNLSIIQDTDFAVGC